MEVTDWITAGTAVVTAITTVVLVIVTARYTRLTHEIAEASKAQITLAKEPNLIFQVRGPKWFLTNLGEYKIYIVGAEVNGERHLITSDFGLIGAEPEQVSVGIRRMVDKVGENLLAFDFMYGSTGHETHRLEVLLDVSHVQSSDTARLVRQTLHQPLTLPKKTWLTELRGWLSRKLPASRSRR